MVSKKLKDAVLTDWRKGYVIAAAAGLHPSMLSQLINNILTVKDDDDRVKRIGEVVGISPEDCFESEK